MNKQPFTFGAMVPKDIKRPTQMDELCDAVAIGYEQGQALYPLGNGSCLGYGLEAERPGTAIQLDLMSDMIDYPARDMTITVQTGITIESLSKLLTRENQELPVDIPCPATATLGAALAMNMSGPRRYGHGTLRDYVLGLTVLNDRGEETKSGGRVVKNVAGYDMGKLHIGALGTLGILTQVTLKVRPRPTGRRWISIACESERLMELLDRIHQSATRPIAISLRNQPGVNGLRTPGISIDASGDWMLFVGFEGANVTLDWQEAALRKEVEALAETILSWEGDVAEKLLAALRDFPCTTASPICFKLNVPPSHLAEACSLLASSSEIAEIQAEAGSGIIWGMLNKEVEASDAENCMQHTLEIATRFNGNAIILRCPAAWKKRIPVWGSPRDDVWLMRKVKEQLDPKRRFNPGRFVDSI